MSTGVKHPADSSGTAFAFVRPLPGASRAADGSSQGSAENANITVPQPPFSQPLTGDLARQLATIELASCLFPPRQEGDVLPPVTGIHLGHFIIEERIGRGGMGAVFRAIDQRLNRIVALKVLTPQQSQDPAAIQRFHNEARAAAQLDHDHIARVHYVGEDRGLHFIAFEFVSGANVRDVIFQRGKLSPHDAVNYTLQIAEALRHTSAQKVVHRDIKPSNIILSAVGRVKLVDLGLARQIRPDQRESEDLTIAGTALGTFDYISPEQAIDARNVDVRSDIYSLGCTLYHMLTGEPPYPRGSMFEKVMNHHRHTPPDPMVKNRFVSPQLSRIVQKMMASNPDERYSTPEQLIVDLTDVARQLGLAPAPADTYAWSTLATPERPPLAWNGSTVWLSLLLMLMFAALLLDRSPWSGTASVPAESMDSLLPHSAASTRPAFVEAAPVNSVPTAPVNTVSTAPAAPSDAVSLPTVQPGVEVTGTPVTGVAAALAAWEHRQANLDTLPPRTPPIGPQPAGELLTTGNGLALDESVLGNGSLISPTPENLATAVAAQSVAMSTGSTAIGPFPVSPDPVPVTPSTVISAIPPAVLPFALVDGTTNVRKEFTSLYAALTNAPDNAVIELQFNGRAAGPQDPIRLTGRRGIRIRPAGNNRPVLEFRLKPGGTPALSSSVRMLSLSNSGVELYDIDIELLTTTQAVVDHWSLFAISGRSELTLKGCSCTIVNPGQLPASVVELPQRESADLTQMMKDQMKLPSFSLRFEDCVVRGQANLISQHHSHTATIWMQNVAVGIAGHLLKVDGSNVVSGPPGQGEQEVVDLYMEHVTAVLGQGLIWASSGNYGRLPLIQIDSRDSLFSLLDAEHALIEFSGHEELDELAERVRWLGRREPNFFELLGPMWLIDAPQSLDIDTQRRVDFLDWVEHWNESGDELVRSGLFRNPRIGPAARFDQIEANDFVLRQGDVTLNPAKSATSDRRDCGVDWSLSRIPHDLPVLPGR